MLRMLLMTAQCPDCSAVITCVEVTRPGGTRFISQHDSTDLVAAVYPPVEGYSLRLVTGRRCESAANHY